MISPGVRAIGHLLGLAVIGLWLTACTSLRVGHDFDPGTNFSGYHAFAWMPREHHATRNPLVPQRAREAIQAELVQKGFVCVADTAAADFIVDFTIGAQ